MTTSVTIVVGKLIWRDVHEESKLARLSPNSIFLAATPTYIQIYELARTPNIEYG